MVFIESGLKFEFDDKKWLIIEQFDIQTDYDKVKNKVQGTKSVDFIGINNDAAYLFEVKGLRGYADQQATRDRLADNAEELTSEIAQKVRDTLSCLMAGARNSTNQNESWTTLSHAIMDNKKKLLVIAWVEEDSASKVIQKRLKSKGIARRDKLKSKLSWLTSRVDFTNVKAYSNEIDGLKITRLP